MATPQQAAQQILSTFVTAGARAGRSFTVSVGKPIVETRTVPTDGLVTVKGAGAFAWDGGVAYAANGAALAGVLSAPAPGQYTQAGAGVYQFNIADALAAVAITYRQAPAQPFHGTVQSAFVAAGYTLSDLIGGLAYAVAQGWLSTAAAAGDDLQNYVLEQAGFAEAGGSAPSLASSAQRLIKVAAAINNKPAGAHFDAPALLSAFIGASGGATFAPEDLMPGYGLALANGWVRPIGKPFDPAFILTAAGVAAAA